MENRRPDGLAVFVLPRVPDATERKIMNSDSNTSDPEKSPQKSETRFETKRTLIGLFKQRPLETNRQFAERIVNAFRAHQAKQQASGLKSTESKP